MMTREEMAQAIKISFEEKASKACKIAGLGDFTIKPSEKGDKNKLAETMQYMNKLFNAAQDVLDAWALVPEHWWENYKIFDLENAETRILDKAVKEFINVWKKRPSNIRRTYHVDSK